MFETIALSINDNDSSFDRVNTLNQKVSSCTSTRERIIIFEIRVIKNRRNCQRIIAEIFGSSVVLNSVGINKFPCKCFMTYQ